MTEAGICTLYALGAGLVILALFHLFTERYPWRKDNRRLACNIVFGNAVMALAFLLTLFR